MSAAQVAPTNGVAATRSAPARVSRALFDLTDRVAIVTGAASGLGEAIAQGLATFGARVVASDVNATGAASVANEIRAGGGHALALTCDVTQRGQVTALVEQTVSALGRVDILVNSAGIGRRAP